jgi:hypothetical protein
VIFKEVKNEIDILLEEVKREPVFMNFLTRFELSVETDKLNTSFVKWMIFAAADGDNEYLEEEKLFAETILDPGRFPAITTIRNCARTFKS